MNNNTTINESNQNTSPTISPTDIIMSSNTTSNDINLKPTTNNTQTNNKTITNEYIVDCITCHKKIKLHPSQTALYPQQNNNSIPNDTNTNITTPSIPTPNSTTISSSTSASDIPIAIQCVCVSNTDQCHTNQTLECMDCSDLFYCRSCGIYYCKKCRLQMKALQCAYCSSFVCSKHCYHTLFASFFYSIEKVCGISVKSHESVYKVHKMLMKPNLFSQWNEFQLQTNEIPFVICVNCHKNNCGCVNWLACVDCRRYFCGDCESQKLVKCGLAECEAQTCCQSHVWNDNCHYCNSNHRANSCGLIFCTYGHCNSHLISNTAEMIDNRAADMKKNSQNENEFGVDTNMEMDQNINI